MISKDKKIKNKNDKTDINSLILMLGIINGKMGEILDVLSDLNKKSRKAETSQKSTINSPKNEDKDNSVGAQDGLYKNN